MTFYPDSIWNKVPGLLEAFQALHDQGFSHSIIADRLSKQFGVVVSRSACIGRARRMGLTRPNTNNAAASARMKSGLQLWTGRKGPRSDTYRQKGTTTRGTVVDLVELKAPEGKGISLGELLPFSTKDGTSCRYPMSMCEAAGLLYCGEPTKHGSWCTYHRELVFKGGRLASAA